jgi:iron-sulfur cluster assembly protein
VVSQTTAVWVLEVNLAILAEGRSRSRRPRPATLYEVTDTSTAAITLTDKAAEKIGELLSGQAEGTEQALRVAVRGGGCSGFQYALAFDKPKDDDNVFEVDGVAVIVDKVSMQFVFGSEVDYVEGLQGAGFQVNNPNVVAACGCGSSFQVKEEDAAEEAAAV